MEKFYSSCIETKTLEIKNKSPDKDDLRENRVEFYLKINKNA